MARFASSRSDGQDRKKRIGTATKKGLRTARALDRLHDRGVDLSEHLDLAHASRPGREVQRVNVDFPLDLLHEAFDRRWLIASKVPDSGMKHRGRVRIEHAARG